MKAVRQRDTAPELAVRKLLHRQGIRFRVCPADLPGRPDIVNRSRRWCIFVHGCFWHGHRSCALASLPKTNRRWWTEKIDANRMRDARKEDAMRALGFRVAVVWQCELADERSLERRLGRFVTARAGR
jgi:DNA mismatch endonuclease (patch repair protein)